MTTRHSLHWGLRPSTILPGGGPGRRKSKPQTLSKARDSQTGTRSRQREADAPSARATASTSSRAGEATSRVCTCSNLSASHCLILRSFPAVKKRWRQGSRRRDQGRRRGQRAICGIEEEPAGGSTKQAEEPLSPLPHEHLHQDKRRTQ